VILFFFGKLMTGQETRVCPPPPPLITLLDIGARNIFVTSIFMHGCNDICQAMQFPPSMQNFITKLMAFFLSSKDLVTKFNVRLLCNVTSCFSSNPHQRSPILLIFRIASDCVTTLIG